ncbi:MAG TPA: STAS domain-containing protein [Acidimicrobiales bacterium]|nr:STAS domain-containing protein [Acidimicrobiales bacterium]
MDHGPCGIRIVAAVGEERHRESGKSDLAGNPPREARHHGSGAESTGELSLRTVRAGRYLVIEAYGEIDIANGDELRIMIDSCLDGGAEQLIVDLSGVRFMDSSGLNVLIGTARRLGAGSFGVVVSRPSIRKIFSVTGIDHIIPVFESVADAVQAVEAGAPADHFRSANRSIIDPT